MVSSFLLIGVDIDSAGDVLEERHRHVLRMTQNRRLRGDVEMEEQSVQILAGIFAVGRDKTESVLEVDSGAGVDGEAAAERNRHLGRVGGNVERLLEDRASHRDGFEGDRNVVGVLDRELLLDDQKDRRRWPLIVDFQVNRLQTFLFRRNLDGPGKEEEEGGAGQEDADGDGGSDIEPRPARLQPIVVVGNQSD